MYPRLTLKVEYPAFYKPKKVNSSGESTVQRMSLLYQQHFICKLLRGQAEKPIPKQLRDNKNDRRQARQKEKHKLC